MMNTNPKNEGVIADNEGVIADNEAVIADNEAVIADNEAVIADNEHIKARISELNLQTAPHTIGRRTGMIHYAGV